MKPDILKKVLKYLYSILLFGYVLFILIALFISLLESFSYSGYFLKHFHLSLNFFIYVSLVCGLLIYIVPADLIKSRRWVKLVKNFFLLNVYVFFVILLVILVVNALEYINYSNFIYSHIHLQPKLLIKTGFLQLFFLHTNLWHIVRLGGYRRNFTLIKTVRIFAVLFLIRFHFLFEKNYRNAVSKIRDYILLIYSVALLVFAPISSVNFIKGFYKVNKGFKQENELKYVLKQMSIYQWIEEYFPLSKNIIFWCEKQEKPVELVSFDPQIIWNSYEGLSRVFLTNCNYVNINSLNKTYEYLNKDNLLLVSITPCDSNLKYDDNVELGSDLMEYFRLVNNNFICKSNEVIPGLYLYRNDKNDGRN